MPNKARKRALTPPLIFQVQGQCLSTSLSFLFPGLVLKKCGVGADAVRKDLIKLAGDGELMLLEFGEAADHEGVFEVGCDHLLEQLHVVRTELTEALVHLAA